MTEAEWLDGTKPLMMLEFLRDSASDRKLRLFACTCARNALRFLTGDLPSTGAEVIRAGEELADGLVGPDATASLRKRFRSIPGDFQWAAVAVANVLAMPDDFGEETGSSVAGHASLYATNAAGIRISVGTAGGYENQSHCEVLRDIFGNPFCPVATNPTWLSPKVVSLTKAIYDDRAFEQMPILADALEEAGCTNADILAHCRGPRPHVRGCWVVDLLLGKE